LRLSPRTRTVLGLAVAAALAAAVLAVRSRDAARGSAAGAAGADAPDVSRADATLDLGDVRVAVSAGPRPLLAFARNRFRFRAARDDDPAMLGDAVVSFTMTMPMGDHRHPLVQAPDGWQEAEVVLPICPSGNRRWFGTLAFTHAGRPRSARFTFDLQQPSQTPGDGTARR